MQRSLILCCLLLATGIFFTCTTSYAQNTDSLWQVYRSQTQHDTIRLQAIDKITKGYSNNPDSAIVTAKMELSLAKQKKNRQFEAEAYNHIGTAYKNKGDYAAALTNYFAALKINKATGNKEAIAFSYNYIGVIYKDQGNYPEALKNYFAALKINEETGNKKGISDSYNNIAIIYKRQNNYTESLKNHFAALKIRKETGDKKGIASSYGNIGSVYANQKNYDEALENHFASLEIAREINDLKIISNAYNNIGNVYKNQGNYTAALKNHFDALAIREQAGDKAGIAVSYNNIGTTYLKQKKAAQAKPYLEKSLALAQNIGDAECILASYQSLSEAHETLGNHKASLANYKLYITWRDSLQNAENTRKSIQEEMQYAFDKKESAARAEQEKKESVRKAEQEKKDAIALSEKRNQQIIIVAVSGGLLLVIVLALVVWRNLRENKHKSKIITGQKQILEARHKEITDSINYAKRIQHSFLATDKVLDENLTEHFVLFKPKDVVSGDFYWASAIASPGGTGQKDFLLACADSTGHGVPGAIMSILNITCLEKAMEHTANPAEILDHTRSAIIERLKNDGSPEGGRDGMDCALLHFNATRTQLNFALANSPLWHIRQGNLTEYHPDKMPVGKHEKQHSAFSLHRLSLQPGDVIYVFTDGYADQFGGPRGKKLKHVSLQKILLEHSHKPMHAQHAVLAETFTGWKGDLEQVDDVCVIGIRI